MPEYDTIRIRDASHQDALPDKLKGLFLLGSHQGTLYLGSECRHENWRAASDTIIFGYSLADHAITGSVRLQAGGGWPASWATNGQLLLVGTRNGHVAAIDMAACKEVGRLGPLGNNIDSIAANGAVYFGVNGRGIHKSDLGLSGVEKQEKKDNVASAFTFAGNNLLAFYFSNGNDPLLDGSPQGGLVEVLDKDLNVLSRANGTPYAVTQAISSSGRIRFSTRAEYTPDIGYTEGGRGELYELNPSDLSFRRVLAFSSGVNVLAEGLDGMLLAGLRDGKLHIVDTRKSRVFVSTVSFPNEVTGAAVHDGKYYVVSKQGGVIGVLRD